MVARIDIGEGRIMMPVGFLPNDTVGTMLKRAGLPLLDTKAHCRGTKMSFATPCKKIDRDVIYLTRQSPEASWLTMALSWQRVIMRKSDEEDMIIPFAPKMIVLDLFLATNWMWYSPPAISLKGRPVSLSDTCGELSLRDGDVLYC
jgi:hypothetical protein